MIGSPLMCAGQRTILHRPEAGELDGQVLSGTANPSFVRLVVSAAHALDPDAGRFAGIPALRLLDDDRMRLPTAQLHRVWDLAMPVLLPAGGGLGIAAHAVYGSAHLLDHMMGSAPTLAEGLRVAVRQSHLILDPAERIAVTADETGLTEAYVWPRGTASADLLDEFAAVQMLQQARLMTGRHLTPARVNIAGRPPSRHAQLVEFFGTARIEFGAPCTSVTYSPADAELTLPRADRALSAILDDYARRFLTTVRPVNSWLDAFRSTFADGHAGSDRDADLARVARSLAMSPRTLQRRLRDEGTSWRHEMDLLRQQRAERLLRTTPLSVEAIAARVGYSDVRALRRAVHRWYGTSPSALRDPDD